ncbi:hypothetical protein D3C83_151740 [compost metagenome]
MLPHVEHQQRQPFAGGERRHGVRRADDVQAPARVQHQPHPARAELVPCDFFELRFVLFDAAEILTQLGIQRAR